MGGNRSRRVCRGLLHGINIRARGCGVCWRPMEPVRLELIANSNGDTQLNVVRLDGKLVLETVHNFIATMRGDACQRLVLDMSSVAFLDSAGVGALVQLFVHRRALGQAFALAAMNGQGSAVMQVSGLTKLLPIYASVDEARKAVA
jgi:anti-anti-sigma factor